MKSQAINYVEVNLVSAKSKQERTHLDLAMRSLQLVGQKKEKLYMNYGSNKGKRFNN